MSNRLSSRVISFLLVFIMVFTMLPTSVFAYTEIPESEKTQNTETKEDAKGDDVLPGDMDANIETGDTSSESDWSTVKGWATNGDWCWGLKFTLYFADDIQSEEEIESSSQFRQLGESIYIQMARNSNLPKYVADLNIYKRMNSKNGLKIFGEIPFSDIKDNFYDTETNIVGVKVPSVSIMCSFPQSLYSKEGASAASVVKFFAGVETTKPLTEIPVDELNFKNTAEIVNLILEKDTSVDKIEPITDANWKQGWYKYENGEVVKGVFKLYVEPYSDFIVEDVRYYMTLHDAIAFHNENPGKIGTAQKTFSYFFSNYILRLANSTFVSRDEPSLKMTGTKGLTPVSENWRKINGWMKNEMLNMGIAVITGGIYENKEVPQLIKTYVEIESVDADGTIHYKKAAPTTIEDINFYVDAEGNYAPFPLFEQLETGIDGGRIGVLNDIITTPYDLTVTSETEWVDTDFITNAGKELTAISSDIAGYMFGLVTGSEQFIESYTDYVSVNKTSDSAFKSLTDYVTKLVETLAAVANTTWNLFDFGAFRRSADAEPLVVVKKLTESVEYTHHLSTEQTLAQLTSKELEELDYTPEIAIVRAGVVDEETGKIMKLTDEYKAILESQAGLEAGLGISTASNTVVLRYIVKPDPSQVNIIRYFNKDEDGTLTEKEVVVVEDAVPLNIIGDIVKIEKPISELPENVIGDYTLTKWVTNSEYPVVEIEDTLPNKSTDGLEGTTISNILNYPTEPITHNLYVEWKVIIDTAPPVTPSTADVPEWRLSRFVGSVAHDEDGDGLIDYATASMSFTKKADYGCYKNYSDIVDLGTYQFDIVYPNGKKNSGISMGSIGTVGSTSMDKNYENLTPNSWFYSKGFAVGTNSNKITHDVNSASINVDATLNMVKSKDNGSLVLANWITGNGSLSNYSITSGNLPTTYSGASQYNQYADLRIGIYNKQTYTHYYGKSGTHRYFLGVCIYCGCSLKTESIAPNSSKVTYTTGNYGLNVTFDRYIQESTTGLIVAKEYKSDNGLTSLRYQLSNTLNIYPEYGMLFEDESGTETLKWVVGDKARQIKPVVYQTLEHKVYVTPTSNGTSVATDSRGTTAASALANQDATAKGKQLIYKGAGVNTSYRLGRSSGSNNTALLTVKTYALDIGNSTLKSAWSNSSYNPYSMHSSLITNLKNDNKASITEKLLVDAKGFGSLDLDNAQKTSTSKGYNLVNYSSNSRAVDSGNAVCFEHKLIIRGGKLIGIQMMKSDGTYYKDPVTNSYSITMDTLKNVNVDLYNALVNMKLYSIEGKKDDTLLKVFEHRKGKGLNESLYITKLLEGRKSIDNLPTSAYNDVGVVLDKGWYSEDTTVLVVKEYVSNFEVPSTSVSDKLPMSIKNLTTPTNKAQFFSNLAKGYTYLKYNLNFASPSVSGIGDIDVYFEFSSYPFDDLDFGRQGVDYLVPNVSITDTTRLN